MSYGTFQSSSVPLEPGMQMPDSRLPVSRVDTPASSVPGMFGEKNYRYDPFGRAPITTPFYQQYAEKNQFEPLVRMTYNVIEQLDGWWFRAAPLKRMKYNQPVSLTVYPRRPLPQVPEDVPPPVWTSYGEEFISQMDRYSAQFEMEAEFYNFGEEAAKEMYTNYVSSLVTGAVISLKLKITASMMLAKQQQWLKGMKSDTSKSMLDVSQTERGSYCALFRKTKGFYSTMMYAKNLARQAQFDFNMAVFPYGTLDKIAMNNYNSENWRVGSSALEMLTMGGKKLAQNTDGLTVYEDTKWSIAGMNKQEEEPFLHFSMHGGWCYNNGNSDCDDDDDPNCKYGFAYICKGQKNWCVKNLLTIIKESGRFTSNGELDPHIFTLADNWQDMCRSCRLLPVQGRLDPVIYRLDSDMLNTDRVSDVFKVARRFGETDVRYSPMSEIKSHVRRMESMMRKRLTVAELQHVMKLETIKRTLIEVPNPTESQEGFASAVTMANSPDRFTYNARGTFDVDLTNMPIFINRDTLTKAPEQIPRIVSLSDIQLPGNHNASQLPAEMRRGSSKAMIINIPMDDGNKDCIIMTVQYDALSAGGFARGEKDKVFGFVAVPLDSWLLDDQTWTDYNNALAVNPTIAWDAANDNGVNDPNNVGATTNNHDASSYVSPEVYNRRASGGTVENLQWVLRPTRDVTQAVARAQIRLAGADQDDYYRAGDYPGQGFQNPTITKPPEMPYFMGGINCLRFLASMHTSGDNAGWDPSMLRDCHDGVQALDKVFKMAINVYTKYNMYFDPNLVPLHMKTNDPEINSMNAAICGLWGDYYRPFLARRPYRLKPAGGYWFFPRSFPEWTDQANSHNTFFQSIASLLRDKFGLASVTQRDIGDAIIDYGRVADAVKLDYCKVVCMASLIDSGFLFGNIKEVLFNADTWNAFVQAYQNGDASLTYASHLKASNPLVYNRPVANYREFRLLFDTELHPMLLQAATDLRDYFNGPPGAINGALLERISRHMLAFGRILSGIITMYLDNHDMSSYNITGQWLNSKRKSALDPTYQAISRSGADKELKVIEDYIKTITDTVRQARNVTAAASATSNTSQYWINTGLMVSATLWKRMFNEMESLLATMSNAYNRSTVLKFSTVYNTPIRPMMGNDYGKPVAGDPITDRQFAIDFANRNNLGVDMARKITSHMSQAMTRGKNSEWLGQERRTSNEASFLRTERLKTHVRDVEALARDLSASRFTQDSRRLDIPTEFLMRDPTMRSTDSYRDSSYLVPVQMESDISGPIDATVEPLHLKKRINEIAQHYEDNTFGRMFALLWCFSPIHLAVIENMIAHRVKPWGVGHVMLRPFQKDLTGAVLFTVGDPQVAQSGFNATISSASFTQQTNKYNIVFSAYLGCTIYQQDKILWLNSQTMHGNKSGLGGEMYTDKDSFDLGRATRPEKDGFMVFVGDNVKIEDIPPCVSITSQYNSDRYGALVNNKAILSTQEQHLPGLIYTITRFRLNELNPAQWNPRTSFWEEKFGAYLNTDCYSEDHCHWNSATKSYSNYYMGNWHFSGLSPSDSDFLDGTGIMAGQEITVTQFKG